MNIGSDKHKLKTTIRRERFEYSINGQDARLYVLNNGNGLEATFSNYGQRLISLMVPDREGRYEDIVLGFDSLEGYLMGKESYFGALVGRYANRIADGQFTLHGQSYHLDINNGGNHLHGGNVGFSQVFWEGRQLANNELEFRGTSPHMDQGYPGNLKVRVNYLLTENDELVITYHAATDRPTIVNMTHHSFFNLFGEGSGSVDGHSLQINADRYTPIDSNMIPTGELARVQGSPFDFGIAKPMGRDWHEKHQQLAYGQGYDHNFVLKGWNEVESAIVFAARVSEPKSGRVMEVLTTEPGMQFYSGNFLDGSVIGKSGKTYGYREAFCLETQHFPDSPNQDTFPSTVLEPGEVYQSTCIYRFTTDRETIRNTH